MSIHGEECYEEDGCKCDPIEWVTEVTPEMRANYLGKQLPLWDDEEWAALTNEFREMDCE